mgnify:CR=1 FL=1
MRNVSNVHFLHKEIKMLKIYNIKEKMQYVKEIAILTQKEWGTSYLSEEEFNKKIKKKI